MKQKIKLILKVILIPLFASFIFVAINWIPKHSGTIELNSDKYGNIKIKRNEYGVPSIEAANYKDVLYGLGVAHAQDKLWSLDLARRIASGTLSELIGSNALQLDKFQRNLSFRRYAQYSMESMSQEDLDEIQSYCDGINDYVNQMTVLPFEYYFTLNNFAPMTVLDSLTLLKFTSFSFTWDWNYEILDDLIVEALGQEFADELNPKRLKDFLWLNDTILSDQDLKDQGLYDPIDDEEQRRNKASGVLDPLANERKFDHYKDYNPSDEAIAAAIKDQEEGKKQENIDFYIPEPAGSNSFAVHGNYTKTGKPILSIDPHLEIGSPSSAYTCQLKFGDHYASGLSQTGIPILWQLLSNHAAVGMTISRIDTTDLYDIELKGNQYLHESEWIYMRSYPEEIKTKGSSTPIRMFVKETHHGVLLENYKKDMFFNKGFEFPEGKNYVLAWTGYQKHDPSYSYMKKLQFAKTAEQVLDCAYNIKVPSVSLVFALENGDIGYSTMGTIPVRRDPSSGQRPQIGSKQENDWLGYVPKSQIPRVVNPRSGYVVAVNNRVANQNIVYGVAANSFVTPRAPRAKSLIEGWIQAGEKIGIDHFKKIQTDLVDEGAKLLLPLMLKLTREALDNDLYTVTELPRERFIQFLDYFNDWDYSMDTESVQATLFNVWYKRFTSQLMRDTKLKEDDRMVWSSYEKIDFFVYKKLLTIKDIKQDSKQYWCINQVNSNKDYPCIYLLIRSYEETILFLSKVTSTFDQTHWKWGSVHNWEYKSPFDGTMMKKFYHITKPGPGNGRTLFLSDFDKANVDGRKGPIMRLIADLSDKKNSLLIMDTGNGENIFTGHLDDQMDLFFRGEYLPMVIGDIGDNYKNLYEINPVK